MSKEHRKERDELERYARRAARGVTESATFMSLWNDSMRTDPLSEPQVVFQVGLAVLLDKPIVIVAPHGATVPEHLRTLAASVKYYAPGDLAQVEHATKEALREAGILKM